MKLYIYCDFDGTITSEDTVDALLSAHANPEWLRIEEEWVQGKIGSRECLSRQIACLENFSEQTLQHFVNDVKIDPYVVDFFKSVKKSQSNIVVVSDGFSNIIQVILQKYHFPPNTLAYSNSLTFDAGRVTAVFPRFRSECESLSGLCKCEVLKETRSNLKTVYIGDGVSDICASKHCDLIFAKGKLAQHCHSKNIPFVFYKDFSDISKHLELS